MTADWPGLELLWRDLDGEAADPRDREELDRLRDASPELRAAEELSHASRGLLHELPAEPAPARLGRAISEGIAAPATVAKVLLFGLPVQRFALVATLLLAVLGGINAMRPQPLSHEQALIREHLAALKLSPDAKAKRDDQLEVPGDLEFGGMAIPSGTFSIEMKRDCQIVDCPATQTLASLGNQTRLSLFEVQFAPHFDLASHAIDQPGLSRDYGLVTERGASMLAWEHEGKVYAFVTEMTPADLVVFAESHSQVAAMGTAHQYTLASLTGHTIHR